MRCSEPNFRSAKPFSPPSPTWNRAMSGWGRSLQFYPETAIQTVIVILDHRGAESAEVVGRNPGSFIQVPRKEPRNAALDPTSSGWTLGRLIEERGDSRAP